MSDLSLVGVPSSAGAYAPGQEKAPSALREAGLVTALAARGVTVRDHGDTGRQRWRPDHERPRAMNAAVVAGVVREAERLVARALTESAAVLVLGGDCTVELATVAAALPMASRTGLIYFDLDADLNTPSSTTDGALDWMGVSHLLGLGDVVPELANLGPRRPMLTPADVLFFCSQNLSPYEKRLFEDLSLQRIEATEVAAGPERSARKAGLWATDFDQVLIHFDVDTIDFEDLPIAENTRRKSGLGFAIAMRALSGLVALPNFRALTVTEVNPDHGAEDGSTLERFVTALADAVAAARFRGSSSS